MTDSHLVPVPGTEWQAWRWALLRSAGFPASGLDRFAAPDCARAADDYLGPGGEAGRARFDAAFDEAVTATAKAVHDVAADPRFRMAVQWQNPGAADSVDRLMRDGPQAPRNSRRRGREEIIAKYWQRYCAKNDTAGFFGPMCWVRLDPDAPPLTGGPGPALIRDSAVFFERWALMAVGKWLAEDPELRHWLPVGLQPHLTLAGLELIHPQSPPIRLSPAEAALVRRCDGMSTAADIGRRLAQDPDNGFRSPQDVFALIDRMAARGLLRNFLDLPMDLTAEAMLRARLAGVENESARQRACSALDRLSQCRDTLALAASPEALATAMAALDAEFTEITGENPRRRHGQTQAGRTLCHFEAVRDAELTFGGKLLASLAALEPLLLSARWLSAALADAYAGWLADQYAEAKCDAGDGEVSLAQLWFPALNAFVGRNRPADAAIAEYLRRWTGVLGLDDPATASARCLTLSTADLLDRARTAFPATAPGWSTARIHSPDLHICGQSAAAVARGEFTVVLGELHIGLPAFDTHFFMIGHPEPDELVQAMHADIPVSRVALAIPDDWPRTTAREAEWLAGPDDIQLGFTIASGIDYRRLVPVTELIVAQADSGLVATTADGRSWPLIEIFAGLLWIHSFDTWKLAGAQAHTPRITVDGLVLVRETWRTSVAASGLAAVTGERQRYLAVRRWRRELGLPERVFVRIGTETKPCYFDLSSPLYARVLCNMLGAAARDGGPETTVGISELLPGPDQAWLDDADGQRYSSELRLQIRDPVSSGVFRPRSSRPA